MLRFYFFGAPRIERDGQLLALRRTKALALLAYLALSRQPQERTTLLALLWPEFDEDSARNNLRRELSLIKATLGDELLLVDRLQVAWNNADAWIDVAAFEQHAVVAGRHTHPPDAPCDECAAAYAAMAQLHTGDFLAGFMIAESAAFDEWQFFQREALRHQLADALPVLALWHERRGAFTDAIAVARRWLALDSLHEPAQRELMRLYARGGQQSSALRQYDELVQLLGRELGVAPDDDTIALYQDIKARRIGPPDHTAAADANTMVAAQTRAIPPAPLYQLPENSGFVGRQRELADLIRRLVDPGCRLLTLVGPGGVGKTRLALEAAHRFVQEWQGEEQIADGVLFVALAGITTSSEFVAALADAARFDFYPNVPPRRQLLEYLRDKRMLLVLDNVEQIEDAAGFIDELLRVARHLRLLVTSRVTLNLSLEWFHPLDGLSFPALDDTLDIAGLARFDAVQLFEQHARRARSDFSLHRERDMVIPLCRLVAGMPLALELAASWLKVLPVEQVLATLERDIGALTARDRSKPTRHRSMRVVLEEAWRLLDAEQQRQLAGLAIFVGGFDSEAAQVVAGATLDGLASLVDQALLRCTSDGRFQLHELLRQFSREQLVASGAEADLQWRHGQYYLALATSGSAPSCEIENIRAAWAEAVVQCELTPIERALEAVYDLLSKHGLYHEGFRDFAAAADRIAACDGLSTQPQCQLLHARLLARQGCFGYLLGDYATAAAQLETSLDIARSLEQPREQAFALAKLGQISAWRGDYPIAIERLRESVELCRTAGDKAMTAAVLELLAEIVADRGDLEETRRLALESLALSREFAGRQEIAHALDRLAFAEFCQGRYMQALQHYKESLAGFDALNYQHGRGLALGGLGLVAWAQGPEGRAEARACFEQSLAIFRKLGHPQHTAERLIDLGLVLSDEGEYEQAQRSAEEALAIARRLGSQIHTSVSLAILARAAYGLGNHHASRQSLGEAAEIALSAEIPCAGMIAMYVAADIQLAENRRAVRPSAAMHGRNLMMLDLLDHVIEHPATWQIYRERARHIRAELQRELPHNAAPHDRVRHSDWKQSADSPIGEYVRPAMNIVRAHFAVL